MWPCGYFCIIDNSQDVQATHVFIHAGMDEMCYMYTMESSLVIRENEFLPSVATGMELESVTLSEIRHNQILQDFTSCGI